MNFKTIQHDRSNSDVTITCLDCGRKVSHSFAAMTGWTFDTEGPPFLAYFCPPCGMRESNEPANTDH